MLNSNAAAPWLYRQDIQQIELLAQENRVLLAAADLPFSSRICPLCNTADRRHRKGEMFKLADYMPMLLDDLVCTTAALGRVESPRHQCFEMLCVSRQTLNNRMRTHEIISEGVPTTPEFMRWFAGSKIVDDSGKPLVVYHGTSKEFEVFVPQKGERGDGGIFIDTVVSPFKFFSADAHYASSVAYNKSDYGSGTVLRCYLRMQNPIDLSTPMGRVAINKIFGTYQRHSKVRAIKAKIDELKDDIEIESRSPPRASTYFKIYQNGKLIGASTRERTGTPEVYKRVDVSQQQSAAWQAKTIKAIHNKIARLEASIDTAVGKLKQPASIWDALDEPDAAGKVKAAGYDGIIFLENSGERSFAVIDSSQIKSVRNRGTFDAQSPNIHESSLAAR